MYPVRAEKRRLQEIIGSLARGGDIPAPHGEWSVFELLSAAGACFSAAMSRGPMRGKISDIELAKVPPEYREARQETLYADLHAAVEFYAYLAKLAQDNEYDEHFEESVSATVYTDGGLNFIPVSGVK
jgi:hypothetical protein